MIFIEPGARVCYLAGPITGMPDLNRAAFQDAADALRSEGWHVLNPLDHANSERAAEEAATYGRSAVGLPGYQDAIRRSLCLLLAAERVFVLEGWQDSNGAKLEMAVAWQVGTRVSEFPSGDDVDINSVDVKAESA